MGRQSEPPTPETPPQPGQESTPPAAPAPAAPAPAAPEPAAPPAAATEPDQSAAAADQQLAQSEYTRSQQAFSTLRSELGLDRKATRDEVIAAVQALKAAPSEPEVDDRTDREKAADERAFTAELRVQEAIYAPLYGKDVTARVIELANTLRTTNDPAEWMTAVSALVDNARAAGSPAPAPAAGEGGQNPAEPPGDIGLPEGDQAPSAPPVPSAGRRESGIVGAVRGIFAEAGIGSRQP